MIYNAYHASNDLAVGNSLALRIPKVAAESAGLHEGDVVEVIEDGGALRIERTGKLDIHAMIAQFDPATFHDEVDWGALVGREV